MSSRSSSPDSVTSGSPTYRMDPGPAAPRGFSSGHTGGPRYYAKNPSRATQDPRHSANKGAYSHPRPTGSYGAQTGMQPIPPSFATGAAQRRPDYQAYGASILPNGQFPVPIYQQQASGPVPQVHSQSTSARQSDFSAPGTGYGPTTEFNFKPYPPQTLVPQMQGFSYQTDQQGHPLPMGTNMSNGQSAAGRGPGVARQGHPNWQQTAPRPGATATNQSNLAGHSYQASALPHVMQNNLPLRPLPQRPPPSRTGTAVQGQAQRRGQIPAQEGITP